MLVSGATSTHGLQPHCTVHTDGICAALPEELADGSEVNSLWRVPQNLQTGIGDTALIMRILTIFVADYKRSAARAFTRARPS